MVNEILPKDQPFLIQNIDPVFAAMLPLNYDIDICLSCYHGTSVSLNTGNKLSLIFPVVIKLLTYA